MTILFKNFLEFVFNVLFLQELKHPLCLKNGGKKKIQNIFQNRKEGGGFFGIFSQLSTHFLLSFSWVKSLDYKLVEELRMTFFFKKSVTAVVINHFIYLFSTTRCFQ